MNGNQSTFAPLGPQADLLYGMTWLLGTGAATIFLVTMGLLALALFGSAEWRRRLASPRAIVLCGAVVPAVVLTALLLHSLGVANALARISGTPLVVEVIGRQFWWEVRDPAQGVVTANEIRLPVGRQVELRVSSPDVIHSLWIPALHGKIDLIPGRENRLLVTAGQPGVMRGQCAEFCGAQHTLMALFAVAEPQADFSVWIERQRAPSVPDGEGPRLFASAGCGACHTIRGTGFAGRLGPDLTLIGTRHSLGAGTLENHRETLAQWIASPQAIKPGNAMPDFRGVLSEAEIGVLAAWLAALQ